VGAGLQWTSCRDMMENQGCTDCCNTEPGGVPSGDCSYKCSADNMNSCRTRATCAKIPNTQWRVYQVETFPPMPPAPPEKGGRGGGTPPPPPPPPPHESGSCERACSEDNFYNCYTQADCEGAGKQWYDDGAPQYTGRVTESSGRCEDACSNDRASNCHSEADCVGVEHQWSVEQCCGDHCPPAGYTRCEQPCSAESSYTCDTKIDCERVGKQWVAEQSGCTGGRDPDDDTKCFPADTSPQEQGRCTDPCSRDNYYNCNSKGACEAIGFEWHPPRNLATGGLGPELPGDEAGCEYVEQGNCAQPCSIMNAGGCDEQVECEAVGLSWVVPQNTGGYPGTYPGGMVPDCPDCNEGPIVDPGFGGGPMGRDLGYCSTPCARSNPQACKSKVACGAAGNQWVIEHIMVYPGESGTLYPGVGPVIVDPGPPMNGRRLQGTPPAPPPGPFIGGPGSQPESKAIGQCEEPCSYDQIYACKTQDACEQEGGRWEDADDDDMPDMDPTFKRQGTCQQGCSFNNPWACKEKSDCGQIGGIMSVQRVGGEPFCNVTSAPCSLDVFVSTCGASVATGKGSLAMCSSSCGRYLTDNFDHCLKHPPAGMT
jgi:hypothetical protein